MRYIFDEFNNSYKNKLIKIFPKIKQIVTNILKKRI